jgi:hypothetical protein
MGGMLNALVGSFAPATSFESFESIATAIVGSGGTSSITFSSIPQTYKHLQLRGFARCTDATKDTNVYMQINGDTSSNYSQHGLYGNGASALAYGVANETNPPAFRVSSGGSSYASNFGVGVLDILDYTNNNKFKTIRSLTGHDENGTGGHIFLFSTSWSSTSAVTSLYITGTTAITQYSHFALYGIKGA